MLKRHRTENLFHQRVLLTEEGLIFVIGCLLSLLWHAGILALWMMDDPRWLKTLTFGFTNVVFGRAPAVAHGTQAGLPGPLMVFYITYVDMATACLGYPVVVLSYKNLIERPRLQRSMQRIVARAEKGLGRFGPYKIAGVFAFVWLPITMTGVVVGAVLGFLMGLRSWITLLTVMAATFTASMCWVYATDTVYSWLSQIDPRLPLIATVTLIVILVLHRLRKRAPRRVRNGGNDPSPEES